MTTANGYHLVEIVASDGRVVFSSPAVTPGNSAFGFMPPIGCPEYEVKILWKDLPEREIAAREP